MDKEWFENMLKHIDEIPLTKGDRELFRNLAYTCYQQDEKIKRYSRAMVNMGKEIEQLTKTK